MVGKPKFISPTFTSLNSLRLAGLVSVTVLAASTLFFHAIEKWNILDSFYFTVVSMATVGYGDFAPQTPEGKIGAIILIFVGIGTFGNLARLIVKRQINARNVRKKKRQARRLRRSQNLK